MLYHCKCLEKPRVLVFDPTGKSAVRVGGTTIHSGLRFNPGTKLLGLNDKSKAALKNVIKGEMVSNDLWTDID